MKFRVAVASSVEKHRSKHGVERREMLLSFGAFWGVALLDPGTTLFFMLFVIL